MTPNHVYTSHPVRPIYAHEAEGLRCLGDAPVRQAEQQGRHNMLWFALSAWLLWIFSPAITVACFLFNIITLMTLGVSYAFCASDPPTPPKTTRRFYTYITPELE